MATVDISCSQFTVNVPRNHIKNKTHKLNDLALYGIYVVEKNPPKDQQALEWLLITDIEVDGGIRESALVLFTMAHRGIS